MNTTGDKKTDAIIWAEQSLERMRQECLDIDIDAVGLCIKLLREFADRTGSPLIKKDAAPVSNPPEIDAVIMLLNKVCYDLEFINDVVLQNIHELDKALADK